MTTGRLVVGSALCVVSLAFGAAATLLAAEFSAAVTALPFPPDTRELEFVAWSEDISFKSGSPLKSIAAFYLKEMASRGWEHDESAAKVEDTSIALVFKHGKVKAKLNLSQWSQEVRASVDCEGLDFTGTDDPAKLAAAGIPVPRAAVYVHKELPLPGGVKDVRFTGEGAVLKSSLALAEAFDHYMRLIPGKGFRESRRPIVTDTRRYTEFRKGTAQLSVNVFSDAAGSRIVLEYKDAQEPGVRPLPAVASLPVKTSRGESAASGSTPTTSAEATPIAVQSNKGTATFTYGRQQFVMPHVACYRTKSRGEMATMVVFSAKPIPYAKMQSLIATKDDFTFGDLYDGSTPDHLTLQLGEHPSFYFAGPGTVLSNAVEKAEGELKVLPTRVQGNLKMPPAALFSQPVSFTAAADAAIMTPTTRVVGAGN